MSVIDLAPLLKEISADAPSGAADLMGDPEFVELEIKVMGTPEREFDQEVIQEAQGPNWREVQSAAVKLLSRTHDLRVAMTLTRAMLHNYGFNGMLSGLTLICGYIRDYWDSLYPELDPEDDFDPMIRNTVLETLSFGEEILGPLKRIDLCASPSLGKYNYRDILIAGGKLTLPKESQKNLPEMTTIEAAFKDTDLDYLLEKKEVLGAVLDILNDLESALAEKIEDTGNRPDLSEFRQVISDINEITAKQLEDRAPSEAYNPEEHETEETETEAFEEYNTDHQQSGRPVACNRNKPADVVNNRQDVIRLLDRICAFYQQNEPGSPVPLLLQRARQLVEKNFLEIIKDLAPDSFENLNGLIIGPDDNDNDDDY